MEDEDQDQEQEVYQLTEEQKQQLAQLQAE